MTFVIDIDGTLIYKKKYYDHKLEAEYIREEAYSDEVEKLNNLYKKGHTIIIHTARRWDLYDITVKQLKKYKIKYHQLVMGKPLGIYVDKDSVKTLGEYFE